MDFDKLTKSLEEMYNQFRKDMELELATIMKDLKPSQRADMNRLSNNVSSVVTDEDLTKEEKELKVRELGRKFNSDYGIKSNK